MAEDKIRPTAAGVTRFLAGRRHFPALMKERRRHRTGSSCLRLRRRSDVDPDMRTGRARRPVGRTRHAHP